MKVEIRGYTGYIRSMEITSDTSEKWSRNNVVLLSAWGLHCI